MTEAPQTIETGTDELLCHVAKRVAVITLNRPHARNSLSDKLSPALRNVIGMIDISETIGAVLITGAGNAFCSGGDVKGMAGSSSAREMTFDEKVAQLRDRQRLLTGALVGLRKPTIAALPGPAAGAGLAIALACDVRIAAETAFVSTGYARVALSGDYGISWLLTRVVGTSRARELMFTADKIDASRCEALGLVNRVVADDELRKVSLDLALKLAHGPTGAFALMKDNLDEALTTDFLKSLDNEAERMLRSAASVDHREAVSAFMEKRDPVFRQNPQ